MRHGRAGGGYGRATGPFRLFATFGYRYDELKRLPAAVYWRIVLSYWRNPPGDRLVAETVANAHAAQFRGHQKEAERKARPVQPWHIHPALKTWAVRDAEAAREAGRTRRRRNPAGIKIKV